MAGTTMVGATPKNARSGGSCASTIFRIARPAAAGAAQPVMGVMIESHLESGAQPLQIGKTDPRSLRYGQSVTDACIGWDDSARLLDRLADAVRSRRRG